MSFNFCEEKGFFTLLGNGQRVNLMTSNTMHTKHIGSIYSFKVSLGIKTSVIFQDLFQKG